MFTTGSNCQLFSGRFEAVIFECVLSNWSRLNFCRLIELKVSSLGEHVNKDDNNKIINADSKTLHAASSLW